ATADSLARAPGFAQIIRMGTIELRLYIRGRTARSEHAIRNLQRLCEALPGGDFAVEVIDVLVHPRRAEKDRILTTPTLIRSQPHPERRVTGDLSNLDRVTTALSLEPLQPEAP
ncbi:MAG: circadian clock KaiB family protein, partial [Longimicrobiales bacterium]